MSAAVASILHQGFLKFEQTLHVTHKNWNPDISADSGSTVWDDFTLHLWNQECAVTLSQPDVLLPFQYHRSQGRGSSSSNGRTGRECEGIDNLYLEGIDVCQSSGITRLRNKSLEPNSSQ